MNEGEQQPQAQNSELSGWQERADELLQQQEANEGQLRRFMPGLPADSGEPTEFPELSEDYPDGSPHIYVASLSDYNNGRLHGAWIDARRELDDIWVRVGRMLAASPTAEETGETAEEWAIHDYEGFGPLRLSEYESLELVSEIGQGIAEHGEAFAAFVELAERDRDRFTFFEDMYRGRWDSLEDYAGSLLDDMGAGRELERLPDWLRPHVELRVESFAQDLEAGGSVMTADASEGGIHVFDFEAI